MNIPNAQRPKVSARLRGYKATLAKLRASVVRPLFAFMADQIRRKRRSLLPVKLSLALAMQMKKPTLRLRTINVPAFYLEQNDLNDLLNGFATLND